MLLTVVTRDTILSTPSPRRCRTLCYKSLDRNWHWMLPKCIHMHACLYLQSYVTKLLTEGESVVWYHRDVQYFGFSKPPFIKHLQILQIKKNALEMQRSLCSKELFLLSFERNSIWLKQVDYYLMKFMPLSINPETLFGHETKNDERWWNYFSLNIS